MKQYQTIVLVLTVCLIGIGTTLLQASDFIWQQISGNWSVVTDNKESYLKENRSKAFNFDYSPLINCNTIISTNSSIVFTTVTHTLTLDAPQGTATYLTFFNATDYRQFYAVQLTGNDSCITTISIIQSDIKDTTLPKQAKGNFVITTLASSDVQLAYGQPYTLAITIKNATITVLVDNKQVLSHTLNEKLEGGSIGFASKNCIPIIDNCKVYNGSTVVFEDDFSKESIRKIILKGKKLTPQEIEEQKKKQNK